MRKVKNKIYEMNKTLNSLEQMADVIWQVMVVFICLFLSLTF